MTKRALGLYVVILCALIAPAGCGPPLAKDAATSARPARPAADVVVRIAKDGTVSVRGEERASKDLLALLRQEARKSARPGDLPTVLVEISAHPECRYKYVQRVMAHCMRAYIWRLSFQMEGRRSRPGPPGETPGENPSGSPGREQGRPERPPEARLHIHWADESGRRIRSPSHPFPVSGLPKGAHIVVKIDKTVCAGLDDLARRLAETVAGSPEACVVIDAYQEVPFRWVFGALEASRKAKVRDVKFQAPPVPQDDDWWEM
ncbi:MAG: hypothetical protein ACYSU0_12170 [Planctomycetota bacterium]|jgi:biopolymer transport protein ExbD